MRLNVRGDRVAIRPETLPSMNTEGNLHLVHNGHTSAMRGTVVAVGNGPYYKNGHLPHVVSVGDRVLFPPDAGEEVICEKDLFIFMKETDILAVIEE